MTNSTTLAHAALEVLREAEPETAPAVGVLREHAATLESVLGQEHGPLRATYLRSEERLGRALAAHGWEKASELACALWRVALRLGSRAESLDVLLCRALQPRPALLTWPLGTWLPEAVHGDNELLTRRRAPVEPINLAPAPGKGFSYQGYLCAILKVTRSCNLRCSYCHDWRADPKVLDVSLEASLWKEVLHDDPYRAVDAVWHGGEPTTLSKRRVLQSLAIQELYRRPGQVVRNFMQTNGTTMTPHWAALLKAMDFSVAVSIDGPAHVHDLTRLDARGRGTFARARRGLRELRTAGLDPGILLVVTPRILELGPQVLYSFLQEEEIGRVGMIPVRPGANETGSENYVTHSEFVTFLLAFESARREAPGPRVTCRELDGAAAALARENPGFCELIGDCFGHYLSIEPDGTVAHCDKFVGEAPYELGRLGRDTIASVLQGSKISGLRAAWASQLEQMRGCPHFSRCRGWCPHERHAGERAGVEFDNRCCGLAALFEGLEALGSEVRR